MNEQALKGTAYGDTARTSQTLSETLAYNSGKDLVKSSVAKVIKSYAKTMTCDILNAGGSVNYNVPIMTISGLEDTEVWGELELPSIDSYVVINFLGDRESFPIIVGTIIPYSTNEYQARQKPVNSDNKQFTKKLLEDVDPKTYRKIFKSGTSIEVQDDGTLIIETPDGSYFTLNATDKTFILADKTGNKIITTANGMTVEDKNTNKVTMLASGMKLEDKNGNVVDMNSTGVKINNNLEVLK